MPANCFAEVAEWWLVNMGHIFKNLFHCYSMSWNWRIKEMDSDSFSAIKFILFFFFLSEARDGRIAVIAVAPFFVYSYVQTRLKDQYNGKWPLSLVYVLKPLITLIRAILEYFHLLRQIYYHRFGHRLGCEIKSLSSNNLINIDLFEKETHFSTK